MRRKTSQLRDSAIPELTRCNKELLILTPVDGGREFAEHENITAKLRVDVYFVHPYYS